MDQEIKQCKNCRQDFMIEPDDFAFYEKIKVPSPTFCPECRFERRLSFRNERTFYKRTCDLCKKNIISTYDIDQPFPVYCQKCWWSDNWDSYSYGRDFDFSRPFFEQFQELMKVVPMLNMQNDDGIASLNSEYAQDFSFSKNCYLTSAGWYCENVMYSYYTCYDKDVADSYFLYNSERCYECFESDRIFDSKYSQLCFDSMELSFCYDMKNCQNCFMCVGLRGKNYCIRNKQYSREEYLEEVKKENLNKRSGISKCKKEFEAAVLKFPNRFAQIIKSPLSTGHSLINSKGSKNCFWARDLENCRNLVFVDIAKDCYDCHNSGNPNLCYEGLTPDNSYNDFFTIFCWKCSFTFYSNNCHSSNNIFGCVALKHSEYSILNKKYTKEGYEVLKEKIIEHMKKTGEWGEFFPVSISPYSYNESFNMDFKPMLKEQAEEKGFRWKEEKDRKYVITLSRDEIPDSISDVDEDILNKVIECSHNGTCNHICSSAFRLIERELQLYQKMDIPIPTLCPNCRYYERVKKRNPPKLWHRKCQCQGSTSENGVYQNTTKHSHNDGHCSNEFETPYDPNREEIIYCENCYNAEVI